ncbi:DDE-Tnp-ISL3 domain-containing protein [Chitinophaga sp. 180180018-2]|nr:DDE-Tnp-ISL3 domain-containing protein [Chitinophaga sp. 212800010-3]
MKYDVVCSVRNLEKMWYNEKGMPSQTIIVDSFHNLKHAAAWMEKIDMRMLVPQLALNFKLPAFIQELALAKHRQELLATKLYMPENKWRHLPEGIYLNINTNAISVKDFEKKSGLYLSRERNLHGDEKTFLATTTKDLIQQEIETLRKHLFVRLIRPDENKGITLN